MNAMPKSTWLLSVEEYLEFEEQSDVRHEYVGGELHAMAGASERHKLIVLNMATAFRPNARDRGCRILVNNVKLQVASNVIYYPDIMVICDATDDDPYIKTRPEIVVEVLSPSTSATDRREKMMYYRQLPSLLCYLVVHQDKRHVERHWRDSPDDPWELEMVIQPGKVKIPGLDITLTLDEIYEGIDLDAEE